ncbi:MAG: hypothetical protein N2V78_05690 [Methanophagales archaeon]|nr:hypothetical protein [Methanophagales archaeon]
MLSPKNNRDASDFNPMGGRLVVGGIMAVVGLIIRQYLQRKHKKLIYNWLYDKTKHLKPITVGSPQFTYSWPSTEEISSALDLAEERVRYICTIHKGIQRQEKSDLWPNQTLEERWAIRKFVRR